MNTNLGLASHASAAGGGASRNSGKEMELELGLGLGLGLSLTSGGSGGVYGITTKEAIYSITRNVSGTKRAAADSLTPSHAATPSNSASQVVGWPPIKTYRMNNLVNHAKTGKNGGEEKGVGRNDDGEGKSESKKKNDITNNNNDSGMKETGHSGFVKVNMDGLPIGRKVDLNAHTCYETLAQLLEEMFSKPSTSIGTICGQKQQPEKQSKLLDGSSEFVLTYEDKEGDFMLVGDVPWRMFLSTVKRLRIMKTSEANGLGTLTSSLAPRFQDKQNTKPI